MTRSILLSAFLLTSVAGFATEGIQLMAERGRQTPLDLEVGAAVTAGQAQYVLCPPTMRGPTAG